MTINTIEELEVLLHEDLGKIEEIMHSSLDKFKSIQGCNRNALRAYYMGCAISVASGCLRTAATNDKEPLPNVLEVFIQALKHELSRKVEPKFRKYMVETH